MDFMPIVLGFVGIVLGFGLAWTLLNGRTGSLKEQLRSLQMERQTLLSEKTEYHERAIKAEEQLKHFAEKADDQQKLLRAEFKQTADSLLEQITTKFTAQSEKKIGDLLNPVQQHLNDFKKLVVDSFTAQGKEQHTLKSEIEKIVFQADSLTKALRGDVRVQGNWGEIMLERILEESGLRRNEDYVLQGEDMKLKGEHGTHMKPDVIVRLPDNKHIIIDSKVSLTAYDRYCATENEDERERHAKEFIRSVEGHVASLESKRYDAIEGLGTPDFVLMFMPIEGAFSFAVQQHKDLHSHAWGRKIVIVSPTTLFATLKTIASLWSIERQNRNAEEIARQGSKLYDKLVGFVDNMEKIGRQIGTVQSTYDEAMKQLTDGKGNLISGAEKLKSLGVKTSKVLPTRFIEEDSEVA